LVVLGAAILPPVRRWLALLLVVLVVGAIGAAAAQAQVAPWQPDLASARDYAKNRKGIIGFAVRTEKGFWGWNQKKQEPSASVIKAMILVAYLDLPKVQGRDLKDKDRAMLDPMIRYSDDHATDKTFDYVGFDGLRALAKRVGMTRFETSYHWGRSKITASDQSRFMLHIDGFITGPDPAIVKRHRDYALKLLSTIVKGRWGLWKVDTPGWKLHEKGGWGAKTGWVNSQVALLTRLNMRVAVAILTHNDPSHDYGSETLRAVGKRLLRGLNQQSVVE
jgi:beta-lactamase family protein